MVAESDLSDWAQSLQPHGAQLQPRAAQRSPLGSAPRQTARFLTYWEPAIGHYLHQLKAIRSTLALLQKDVQRSDMEPAETPALTAALISPSPEEEGLQGPDPALRGSPQQPATVQPPPKPKCPIKGAKKKKTEEILHAILPPREWADGSGRWMQRVSTTPSSRMDVLKLEEQLNLKLKQRQARETGLCHVRRELYSQCFEELIRQETINCTERGLLLLQVRDEISMCIAAYETLDDRSMAFSIRKVLPAEQGKAGMEEQIEALEGEKLALEEQLKEMEADCEADKQREKDRRVMEDKKHTEDIEFLKRTNQQLKFQLLGIAQK
ncbi:axonemal dynein light intermediate polypeptide 1-like [Conger conger]|uniref:axonemal dynein light intermediate polypeptide 1-like n=1 Tax=Conger conger TaxID=82655 RepID=UPI002A5A1722|nr:axonemal dynein light intermediate polypeptide 1-like [Conger conger]